MTLPRLNETTIAELNEVYRFNWSTNDFLVSDEINLLRTHRNATHIQGYIIGICSAGTTSMEVNLRKYSGGVNSMIITTPQQLLRVVETSKDFKARFIVFSNRFLSASNINSNRLSQFSFTGINTIPVIHVSAKEALLMKELFEYIWKRFRQTDHPFRKEITANLLMVLLQDFEAVYQKNYHLLQSGLSRKQQLSRQFLDLLFLHFRKERSVQFYAGKLFVTPKYLTEILKELTGKTTGQWIQDAIIAEASALLKNEGLSVQEIAHMLSFPDQSSFGKFFRKATGVSPSGYRNKPS